MQFVITAIVAAITLSDILASGNAPVCDAQIVPVPPIAGLDDSWIAAELAREPAARLLAPGPNVGNLFGVSCVPQYLGLGPAEYFHPDAVFDTMPVDADTTFPSDSDVRRLRDRGVTHLLTQEAVSNPSPELELIRGPGQFPQSRMGARKLSLLVVPTEVGDRADCDCPRLNTQSVFLD